MGNNGWILSGMLILLILCITPPASGDVLPPESPETQGIEVSTNIISMGMLSQEVELQWDISSEILGANMVYRGEDIPELVIEPEPPLNPDGEVQSHMVYSEDTLAVLGSIDYRKEYSFNTGVQADPNPNMESMRLINFVADDVGKIYSTEDILMDNVGTCIRPDPQDALCPFFANIDLDQEIPAFCNKFEAGSAIDMRVVSAATSAAIRNINPAGDPGYELPVPVIDGPARADYSIRITELDSSPSDGLVSSYSRIQITEGGEFCPGLPVIAQQIRFAEDRSASGDVSLFQYLVSYESGVIR